MPDADFAKMKEMAAPIINRGCHTGDGWLVAAEVADTSLKTFLNDSGHNRRLIIFVTTT